jgi:hypothetical protein
MGAINLEDKRNGILEGNVENSKVKILLERVSPTTVKLTVKARKNLLPNIDLANKIYNKIIRGL